MFVAGGAAGEFAEAGFGIDRHVLPVPIAVADVEVLELLFFRPVAEEVAGLLEGRVGVVVVFASCAVGGNPTSEAILVWLRMTVSVNEGCCGGEFIAWLCGGESGIRTHDGLPHTAFRVRRVRPSSAISPCTVLFIG